MRYSLLAMQVKEFSFPHLNHILTSLAYKWNVKKNSILTILNLPYN